MEELLMTYEERMEKNSLIEKISRMNLGEEFGAIRAGRANPRVLTKLQLITTEHLHHFSR